jgi:hypothetical protein
MSNRQQFQLSTPTHDEFEKVEQKHENLIRKVSK